MIKFLAFILILCVLFGVEATRSFIFGAFGFIFWVIVILAAIGLVIDYVEKHNTPDKKEARKKEKAAQKEKEKAELEQIHAAYRRIFWPVIITVALIGGLTLLLIFTSK